MRICIALDVMGGDAGPSVVIPAALEMVKCHADLHLILVGDENIIRQYPVSNHPSFTPCHTSQQVEMNESPALALRHKKDSSLRVMIDLVKQGQAQACVSAGNTGALMATAKFVLKTFPYIDRPAIISRIPTINHKNVRILDLGANVDSKPEHLFQFALMGTVLIQAIDSIDRPSVALLNIGHEAIKGNELVQQTAKLLQNNSALNYTGFIEANEIFNGQTDLVVCDGFVGNIALKASEGSAKLMTQYLKKGFQQNWMTKLAAFAALPVLKSLKKNLDPSYYNGASLLGLQGIVIKSHGSANRIGFMQAIKAAMQEVENNVVSRMGNKISDLLMSKEK